MTTPSHRRVWATVLTNVSYLPGTLVLGYSLQLVKSRYPLVVLVTSAVSQEARDVLHKRGLQTRLVDYLTPSQGGPAFDAAVARFVDTWTKLRAFELEEYEYIVLLDSDMLVMRNMDELLELDLASGWIAAAHVCACNPGKYPHYPRDWVPTNCAHTSVKHPEGAIKAPLMGKDKPRPYSLLNSGTVVLRPSKQVFDKLVHHLNTSPLVKTYSFADQDLLSDVFAQKWKPLPWCYNALKPLRNIHPNLWRDNEVRCLHYIFTKKPWHGRVTGDSYQEVGEWWWERFDQLDREMVVEDPAGRAFVRAVVTE